MSVKILAFAGSTREGSFNKKLLAVAIAGAESAGGQVTKVELKDLALPLYDGDLEASSGLPAKAKQLKRAMIESDAFLIASPEYNSGVSGVLKNAIDWVSRPQPNEPNLVAFTGKVAAIMSASPGALGGLRGLFALRQILSNIGVLVLPDQIAVSKAMEAFEASGNLKDAKQQERVQEISAKLVRVAERLRPR
ncbi:MAG: NADPH-dependent FMN reductase [Burkholderiales bacterium]